MNYLIHFFVCAILLFGNATISHAKNVILGVGETYSEGDLNVMCVQQKRDALIVLKECQFWDDFNKRCLYEKKIYSYGDFECVAECQHWDKFSETCHYEIQCAFYPSPGIFVQTICQEFDEFSHTCKRTKQTKITESK